LLGPAAAFNAAEVEIEYALASGSLVIGSTPIPIPSGAADLTGNWDSESGALDATLAFNPFTVDLAELLPGASGNVTITGGAITGTVPPDGTPGAVSTSITVGLEVLLGGNPLAVCSIGPVALELRAELLEEGATIKATGAGFNVPAATGGALCDTANLALGLPTSDSSAELVFVAGELPPPPAPDPAPAPGPGPAAPSTPTSASPTFTG